MFRGVVGAMIFSALISSVGNDARATSPPGVVDIFVTTSAYSYTSTYTVESALVPNVGISKQIYVNGRVTDGDGVGTGFADGDLDFVELRLYRENVGTSCTPDVQNCYKTFCSVTPNSGTVLNYSCMVEVSYLMDSTMVGGSHENEVWNAEVLVQDDADQLSASTQTFEVDTLLALLIPTSVNFGELTPGQITTSQTNTPYTVTQNGNDVASVMISGGDMTCTNNATVPVENIHWSLTDVGYADASTVALSGTPVNVGIAVGLDETAGLSKSLYFNLSFPTALSGTCTGSLSVDAIGA